MSEEYVWTYPGAAPEGAFGAAPVMAPGPAWGDVPEPRPHDGGAWPGTFPGAAPAGYAGAVRAADEGLWEGLRNTVRHELVARQIDEQMAARFPAGQRLRVLDVGLAHGTQALRLARAGHEVTALESDPSTVAAVRKVLAAGPAEVRERVRLLEGDGRDTGAHFTPGAFDLVLCHGVLMYIPEPDPLLAGLARVLAPGGLLSLLVRNADALALRPALAGDWDRALAAFDSPYDTDRTGTPVRADRRETLTATLAGIGTPLRAWYGVRVFTDPPARPRQADLDRLLAAEDRAGRTDPYRAVATLLHLCGVRGG